jgi:hypothetical protein
VESKGCLISNMPHFEGIDYHKTYVILSPICFHDIDGYHGRKKRKMKGENFEK